MKTATIAILTPLFILSLVVNVWFYTAISDLNSTTNRQLDQYSKSYQLPHKTLSQLQFNCGKLISKNQELQNEKQQLQAENRKYKRELNQIQQEARRAQKLGIYRDLLQLIFSLIF